MTNKSTFVRTTRANPYGALLKFEQYIDINRPGHSRCVVDTGPEYFSPGGAVHGGFLFTVMDNCMGAALVSTLKAGEGCATIEMKVNYLKAVFGGQVESSTRVLQKGKRIAVLESQLRQGKDVVAIATSTYAIFQRAPDVAYNMSADRVATEKVAKNATSLKTGKASPSRRPAKSK